MFIPNLDWELNADLSNHPDWELNIVIDVSSQFVTVSDTHLPDNLLKSSPAQATILIGSSTPNLATILIGS